MVRRTREAAAATREQLLDAAERVFRDRGVTRTSLAEIAAEAGVTRGAVYWHFRDKADLFAAMCERATSPMDALVDQAHGAAAASPLATLRDLCVDALTHLAEDPRTQAVFEIMFHRSELAGEMSGVADRHDRDCCNARAITASTQAMHAFVTGVMHEWTLDPAAYDLRGTAPALVDMFVAGLAARPPRVTLAATPAGDKPRAGAAPAARASAVRRSHK